MCPMGDTSAPKRSNLGWRTCATKEKRIKKPISGMRTVDENEFVLFNPSY